MRPVVVPRNDGTLAIENRPADPASPPPIRMTPLNDAMLCPVGSMTEVSSTAIVHGVVEGRHFKIAASKVEATVTTTIRWRSTILKVADGTVVEEREILAVEPHTLIAPLGFGLTPEVVIAGRTFGTALDVLSAKFIGTADGSIEKIVDRTLHSLRDVLDVPVVGQVAKHWLDANIREAPDARYLLITRPIGRLSRATGTRITIATRAGKILSARFSSDGSDLTAAERDLAARAIGGVDLALLPDPGHRGDPGRWLDAQRAHRRPCLGHGLPAGPGGCFSVSWTKATSSASLRLDDAASGYDWSMTVDTRSMTAPVLKTTQKSETGLLV